MYNLVFFLGTKAQFIKTIPVINTVDDQMFNIYLYNTCQHEDITKQQIKSISNKFTHIKLLKNQISAKNIYQILSWFIKAIAACLNKKVKLNKTESSLCIIHGNTLSTVIGVFWGKLNKIKILHIEGGYRSFNWLKPFPEELIRYWVSKSSDYVICFDGESEENLKAMKIKGEIIRISRNTIFDTIPQQLEVDKGNSKLVISVHRNENVYSTKVLGDLVNLIIELRKNYFKNVIWYVHKHTKSNLIKKNFLNKLTANNILIKPLLEHNLFIKELHMANCVLTDGESVLEECSIIGVPTYALLNSLENESANAKNILVSKYLHKENLSFFKNIENFRENKENKEFSSPSVEISEVISKMKLKF
jgi:UDP-N-acetylglucosamine 2-epimerase (non-hydrolysing)